MHKERDEPKYLGAIPVRTELPISPGSPDRKIGWTATVYDGPEVYRFAEDGAVDLRPLTQLEDVQEGVELAVPGVVGGYHRMTVAQTAGGFLARANEHLFATLCWDKDDRHCWSMGGLFNTRGLRNLEFQR